MHVSNTNWKTDRRVSVGREPGPRKGDIGFEMVQIARVAAELGPVEMEVECTGEMMLERVAIALRGRANA